MISIANYISHGTPHLLIVLHFILQDDPVGSVRRLPGQWDGVSCDILRLDGRHWRGGWRDDQKRDGKKKKKNYLVHWFLPVLRVVFSLGDTESLLCCSPKFPTLFSCWESQTVCQATRQSLPFVSELGYHSKLWGVTELYGHTAQLPKQECMAILYFWTNGWHQ